MGLEALLGRIGAPSYTDDEDEQTRRMTVPTSPVGGEAMADTLPPSGLPAPLGRIPMPEAGATDGRVTWGGDPQPPEMNRTHPVAAIAQSGRPLQTSDVLNPTGQSQYERDNQISRIPVEGSTPVHPADATQDFGPAPLTPTPEQQKNLGRDHPSKWQRFGNALGAAGLELLKGHGILGAGLGAIEGAQASEYGSGRFGKYGDERERNEDFREAQRRGALGKIDREGRESEADIKLKEAQAGWYNARPEIEQNKIDSKATLDRDKELRRTAQKHVATLLGQKQSVPDWLMQAAYGDEAQALDPAIRYAIVAGGTGVYMADPYHPDNPDVQKLDGVPPRVSEGDQAANRRNSVRATMGDPDDEADNPEWASFTSNPNNSKAARRAAQRYLPELQNALTPQERERYNDPTIPLEERKTLEDKVSAAWDALPMDKRATYYDQLPGSPKHKVKNRDIPGWLGKYNRAMDQERVAGQSAGAAPANVPRSEEDAKAKAAKLYPNDTASQQKYLEIWRNKYAPK